MMLKSFGDEGKSDATITHTVRVELNEDDITTTKMDLAIKIAEIFQSEIRTIVLAEAAIGRRCELNPRLELANMANH